VSSDSVIEIECGTTVARRSLHFYQAASKKLSCLQSPFLLAIRLYWGWQFAQTGWGKLHNLAKITGFFASLGIPFPAFNAHFVSGLEFFGGLLLILGLASRLTGLLLAGNMFVAYWTADHEALLSIFSDPGKFYIADPYTFLFASLVVLIYGAGIFSVDAFIAKRWKERHWTMVDFRG
jgi:putative oxidoreductase